MSDVRDPYLELPLDGVRLIEASAGTGKTFTLATLVTRLVVERGLSPWQALEASRKAISQHWFKVFGLFFVLMLIMLLSMIPLGIGLIWTLPLLIVTMGVLYRTIFGVLPPSN